jgi:hypothetical protein
MSPIRSLTPQQSTGNARTAGFNRFLRLFLGGIFELLQRFKD